MKNARGLSHDASLAADKVDVFIRELYNQFETIKAEADAAAITAEQTFSVIEQKYTALTVELSSLQSRHSGLTTTLDNHDLEFGQLQSRNQLLFLQSVEKVGEIENKCYRISPFAGNELLERHNSWLNEELTTKVDSVMQLRKANVELDADMSSKLSDAVNENKLSSDSLKLHKDRVSELEGKLASMEEELLLSKKEAAAAEQRFAAEISTVTKLLELCKQSSDEWSKKAGELERVIKALETHFNQMENEHKEKLEKEEYTKKHIENVPCIRVPMNVSC